MALIFIIREMPQDYNNYFKSPVSKTAFTGAGRETPFQENEPVRGETAIETRGEETVISGALLTNCAISVISGHPY